MPCPVTLAELRTRALRAADMTTAAAIQYIKPDEQNAIINEEYENLWDKAVMAFEDYFVTSYPITLVPGTLTYPLPADFYKARNIVWWTGSPNMAQQLDWFEEHERARLMRGTQLDIPKAKIDGSPTGPVLSVVPAIISAQVMLRYIPQCQELLNDTDTVNANIPRGWVSYIVYGAAVKFRGKAQLDTTSAENRFNLASAKVDQVRSQRQASGQKRVRDVYNWSRLRERRRLW